MARLVLSKQDTIPFIPEDFQGKDKAPTFLIATLTGTQRHEVFLMKSSAHKGAGTYDNGKFNAALLQAAAYGLRGWENVEDQDGNPVEYPGTGMAAVHLLPMLVGVEIGAAINNRSELSEEQRGN